MIQIDFDTRLSIDTIMEILNKYDFERYKSNWSYYLGENQKILTRRVDEQAAPDNKIAVPYARKIITTVTGYMYKPGLITYSSDEDKYIETLQGIFDENNETIKTSEAGKQTSIQGVGYEVHYTQKQGSKIMPRFAKLKASEGIPVYNTDIEPELTAFLHPYTYGDMEYLDVYYADVIAYYERRKVDPVYMPVIEEPHIYGQVPIVVYRNNEEELGDFEHVKSLIDAYDVLMSDSMNEFDRFAWAYLIFKGYQPPTAEEAKSIKQRKIFGVDADGAVQFLTKDINHAFIMFMAEWIRKEIHKQTHVPDFLDSGKTGDALSGVAIDKLLYDFEFVAATKEALFKEGLYNRIDLINRVLGQGRANFGLTDSAAGLVEITFTRNKPDMSAQNAETMQKYNGMVSLETLLGKFAPFVTDVQAELERLNAEKGSIDLGFDSGSGDEAEGGNVDTDLPNEGDTD